MTFRELEAFAEECAAIDLTLADVPPETWQRPALGEWNLAQLVAHIVRGASRISEYINEPVSGGPVDDRISYWHNVRDLAASVAQRAIDEARGVDPASLPARFTQAWKATVAAAHDQPPDRVMATIQDPMRLDDYTSSRVLEMVVHHTDVCRALDRPPVNTPAAAQITAEILEGLLGGPKPHNMGRARFIATATGRMPSDDPRFPVLS